MKKLILFITFLIGLQYLLINCTTNSSSDDDNVTKIGSVTEVSNDEHLWVSSQLRVFSGGNIDRSGMTFRWYSDSAGDYKIKGHDSVTDRFDIRYGLIEDPFLKSYYVYGPIEDSGYGKCDSVACDSTGKYTLIRKHNVALSIIINTMDDNKLQKVDTICFFKDMFADYIKKVYNPNKDLRYKKLQYNLINFDLFHLKLDSIRNDTIYFNFGFGQNETCFMDFYTYKYWANGDSIYYEDPFTYEDDSLWGTDSATTVSREDIYYTIKTINRYVAIDSTIVYDTDTHRRVFY